MKLMDKDFYKDLEKIKTIGSTYMAAVGLAPTTNVTVSNVQGCSTEGLVRWQSGWGACLTCGKFLNTDPEVILKHC